MQQNNWIDLNSQMLSASIHSMTGIRNNQYAFNTPCSGPFPSHYLFLPALLFLLPLSTPISCSPSHLFPSVSFSFLSLSSSFSFSFTLLHLRSEPLTTPSPFFDSAADQIICYVIPKYGNTDSVFLCSPSSLVFISLFLSLMTTKISI